MLFGHGFFPKALDFFNKLLRAMLSESMCDRYVIYRLIAGSEGRCNIQDASEDIGMSSIAECCSRRSVVG